METQPCLPHLDRLDFGSSLGDYARELVATDKASVRGLMARYTCNSLPKSAGASLPTRIWTYEPHNACSLDLDYDVFRILN